MSGKLRGSALNGVISCKKGLLAGHSGARKQCLAQHSSHSSGVQELPLGAQLQSGTESVKSIQTVGKSSLLRSSVLPLLYSVHALFQALDVWAMGITLYCFVYGKVSCLPAAGALLCTGCLPFVSFLSK